MGPVVILGTTASGRTILQRFEGGVIGLMTEEMVDGTWLPDPESGVILDPEEVAALLRALAEGPI